MSQQRFEGPTLESVLADVADRVGPGATIVSANRLRRGGLAGFFAKERYEVLVDGARAPDGTGGDTPVSTETSEFAAMLDALITQAGADDLSPAPSPPPPPPPPAPPASPAPQPVAPAGPPLAQKPVPVVPEVGERTPYGAFPPPPVAPAIPAAGSEQALVRLGVPEELVTHAAPQLDPARFIAGLMEHAPRPGRLPRGKGTVVASVGERVAALALARDLAAEMGVDPDDVVLASPNYRGRAVAAHRRLPNLESVDEQRRSWRRRPRPTVVAVDAGPGPAAGAEWGRRVLDVLEPTMIWASVEATRKPEDISAWADRIGGLDAIAVTNLDETESPAAVLHCGLPVGRLDGRPATPALWGALLAGRLEAC